MKTQAIDGKTGLESGARSSTLVNSHFQIAVSNEHSSHQADTLRIRHAVLAVLDAECPKGATISVAIVDDPTIRRLHREFLRQDRPTDVLSFLLDETLTRLDGEVIASADTAAKAARRYGGTADDELLLYVIHGTLHLLGYDDQNAKDQKLMRARERRFLREFGLAPRYSSAGGESAKTARVSNRSPRQRS